MGRLLLAQGILYVHTVFAENSAMTSTTTLALTASLAVLVGAVEQSPPHECEGYRPCAPHEENEHNPNPRAPVTMAPVSSANGSTGNNLAMPPSGRIDTQGLPPRLTLGPIDDHPETPLTLRSS